MNNVLYADQLMKFILGNLKIDILRTHQCRKC